MSRLVQNELLQIPWPHIVAEIKRRLLPPTLHYRTWPYGPGVFPCWLIATDESKRYCVVYCRYGHWGNWGFVNAEDGCLGMDGGWNPTRAEPFLASAMFGLEPPSGFDDWVEEREQALLG